jgi:Zn-dependent protease
MHIDIIGLIFIIFAGFGWAKPVQFYPDKLKHPNRDKAIIAFVGPFSNLLLGIFFIFIIKGLLLLDIYNENAINIVNFVLDVLYYWAFTNIGLFVFNMFPIPPLDGSHIIFSSLNLGYETEAKLMKIGTGILFFILILQNRTDINILPIGNIVRKIISVLL